MTSLEVALMTTNSNKERFMGSKSPWFGIGKFLFVVSLIVIFFLLAQSMMRHRFLEGGRFRLNGTIGH